MKIDVEIEDLSEEQAKEILTQLIESLDDLDGEDYFGTEGWRHFLGFEE